MTSPATHYKKQDYSHLKKNCLDNKKLFEDPEFPVTNSSLFYKNPPHGCVVWKRPREISDDPHLFVEGISSHDLNQGDLGNCWFVAACSCLALKPDLWPKVIPDWKEQEWDPKHPERYAGIFHFQFWVFGEWMDVVVDDRLPTINGELIYCYSNVGNEFWSALLEKAYAKLSGCYESLDGGNTADAVVDFSGAVAENIDLETDFHKDQKKQDKQFEDLQKVYNRDGIICSSIEAASHEIEARMPCGLVKGHAYAVTEMKSVHLEKEGQAVPLIRMRNPWGKTEWNGAWSDSSAEWKNIGGVERNKLGITVQDDGEFWMSFADWCKYFTFADVCHVINTPLDGINNPWNEVVHFASWTKHLDPLKNRCGGCINNKNTFLQNPQYVFDVTKDMDEVLVSLQQRDMKIHRMIGQGENLHIGFTILKVEYYRKDRLLYHFTPKENMHMSEFFEDRTVCRRWMLPKGRYIIIPSTFEPEKLGDFMLRVFTHTESGCRELLEPVVRK
ncbi:calpain-5-like isoform X2 [Hypomesus transpacificus]|uniref:calpain-5-like isoform X2 n=1 Tax=Hypomesus transpacificus TaxID=137520 RepID=UPI001F084908|nr:calpain-5-like isoform X2 [Hypomesus transpacificus]